MPSDVIDLAISGRRETKAGRFAIPLSSGRTVTVEAPLDLTIGEFKELVGEVAVNLGAAIAQARELTAKPQLVRAQSVPERVV